MANIQVRRLCRAFLAFLIGLPLFLTGCLNTPNYSDTPEISFKTISREDKVSTDGVDTLAVVVNFKDGNGDLGLASTETNPPYNPTNTDGSANKFFYNYFITIQKKQPDGSFVNVVFPDGQTFNGRYPKLTDNMNGKPLEGELEYAFEVFWGLSGGAIRKGDVIRLEVQIADRSLKTSNIITTAEIKVGG